MLRYLFHNGLSVTAAGAHPQRGRNALRLSIFLGLFLGGLTVSESWAQSADCMRYRVELQDLERTGPGRSVAMAERQRAELNRLVGYYRSLGCERGGLNMFRRSQPPPQCASVVSRLRSMENNLARLERQARGPVSNFEQRRRVLLNEISKHCRVAPRVDNRGFFGRLFNTDPAPPRNYTMQPDGTLRGNNAEQEDEKKVRYGGSRIVCVRTCDGSYFPLNNIPAGRGGADSMCQALCPATPVAAYKMPGRDNGVTLAISFSGQRYINLPYAMAYRETYNPDCACKAVNETWAEVLGPAEKMLRRRPGDILVTEERSDEMAQPKLTAAQLAKQKEEEKRKSENEKKRLEEEEKAAEKESVSVETAIGDESGIGAESIREKTAKVLKTQEGPRALITDASGGQSHIRIIAPDIIPPPPNTIKASGQL